MSAALKEDLLRVKDALDLYLRGGRGDVAELLPQAGALDRIGDTLGMIGLGGAQGVVQEQGKVVHDIATGARAPLEGDLLEVASALIYIDHSLDDQVARLGHGLGEVDGGDLLAQESRKVMGALAREAAANFAEVRSAFVAFVETDWDHASLDAVPRLLGEVAGAMRMLELPEPAGYLEALRRYSHAELIGPRAIPGGGPLDTLADALAGMEYYLESLQDPLGVRQDMLDKARTSLEQLAYWPLPDERPIALPEPAAGAPAATPASAFDTSLEDIETEAAAEAAAAAAVSAAPVSTVSVGMATPLHNAGFNAAGEEIDDEIREIFLEEFQEEIGNLDELLPAWRLTPEDNERLRPIRRVFHTLKGSGRLVGAQVLGEFSWHVENMLNRVLDGSRPASPEVVAFVGQARAALPQLHAALRGESTLGADLPAMEAVADRLAAGEDVLLETGALSAAPAAAAPVVADAVQAAETATVEVDAVLLEILGTEVGGHLETVDAWLAQARGGDATVNDGLLRAIHPQRRVRDDRTAVGDRVHHACRGLRQAPAGRGSTGRRRRHRGAVRCRRGRAHLHRRAPGRNAGPGAALRCPGRAGGDAARCTAGSQPALHRHGRTGGRAPGRGRGRTSRGCAPPRRRSPRSRAPRSRTPRSRTPRSRTPRSRTPRSRTPRSRTARSRTPRSRTPRSRTPPKAERLEARTSRSRTSKPNVSEVRAPRASSASSRTSKPNAQKPERLSKPNASKPNVSKPNASKPNASKPNASKPNVSKPNASKPNASKPSASKPNVSKPNVSKPNVSKPNASKPSVPKPSVPKPNASKRNVAERLEAERPKPNA